VNTKDVVVDKKSTEVSPVAAVGIIGVAIAIGAYFLMDSSSAKPSGENVKQIITQVNAPEIEGAPTLLPLKVQDMAMFNNDLIKKRLSTLLKEEEAKETQAQVQIAKNKSELADISPDGAQTANAFGHSNKNMPAYVMPEQVALTMPVNVPAELTAATKEQLTVEAKSSIQLLSIATIHGSLEATILVNDEVSTINELGVTSGTAIKNLIVKSLSDSQVCIAINKKEYCLGLDK
jgi:hypothetical protein